MTEAENGLGGELLVQGDASAPGAGQTVALLLPAMTFNASAFPDFGIPTLCADYGTLVGADQQPCSVGMRRYSEGLQRWLQCQAAWLRAELRIVVAHSFGAALALDWLAYHPAPPVHGMVLISACAGPLFERVRLKLGRTSLRLPVAPLMPAWNTRLVTRLCKRLCTGGSLEVRPVDFQTLRGASDVRLDIAGWRNTDWQALRATRGALDGFDLRARLWEIEVPALILQGGEDRLFETSEASLLASSLPHARATVIASAGHGLPLSHPRALQAAVNEILAWVGTGRVEAARSGV